VTPISYLFGFGVFGLFALYYMVIHPRLSKPKPVAAPTVSGADYAPETARLATPPEQHIVTRLVQRDVETAAGYLRTLRGDDRLYACRLFEDLLDHDMLEYVVHQNPQSSVHHLLRGCHLHAWAWQARGHGSANEVDEEGWRQFALRMRGAEQDFTHAGALDPTDPAPHAMLVAAACHLDRGEPTAFAHLVEAMRRDPECYGALDHFLNYFTAPHWGGSNDKCLAFARQHAAGSPPGSVRPMLVLEAHYYIFHHEHAFGDRKRGDAHAADPAVQREVLAAHAASIGHPAHVARRRTNELRNLAAWWFYMMRDRERCARELALIGEAYTDAYWQRLGPPDKQLKAVRKWAAGGRWKEVGW
jgi:hypothetical protein